MSRPERFPYERRLEDLLAVYRQAQRTIAAQITAALQDDRPLAAQARRAQLAQVLMVLAQLGVDTDPAARELVADAYHQSADRTASTITGLDITPPLSAGSFTQVSVEAVAALQDSIIQALTGARATIGRQATDVFAAAQRQSAMLGLLGAQPSRRQVSRDIARRLRDRGVAGFVDKAGRRWSLDNYTEMAARTVTRQAVVAGALHRMAADGVNLARVSSHVGSCPICVPYDGKLVSLDGTTSTYQGEDVLDATMLPPFHPRCEHTLIPVATDIEALRTEMAGAAA